VFYEGLGEYKEAWQYLQTAADGGNPEALCRLAKVYLEPERDPLTINLNQFALPLEFSPIKQSDKNAEAYFKKAAEKGSKQAAVLLENMYFEGRGAHAVDYFERGIGESRPSAYYGLAVLYEKGIVVKKDLGLASKLFEDARKAGSSDAYFRLADLALQNNETLENCTNTSTAHSYLILAADLGHAKAAFIIGKKLIEERSKAISESSNKPTNEDTDKWKYALEKARKYLTIANQQKYPGAACQLASLNLKTGGVASEIVQFLMQAIVASDLDAYCLLGELHLVGVDGQNSDFPLIQQDYGQAKNWLTAAADLGHARAAFLLTRFYNPGIEYDFEWCDNSSEEYETEASVYRQRERNKSCEDNGDWYLPLRLSLSDEFESYESTSTSNWVKSLQWGLNNNIPKLYRYLSIAADGGIPDASYRLAKLLEQDPPFIDLSEQDRKQKIEACYKKAADLGHSEAALALYNIYQDRDWSWSVEPPFNDPKEEAKKYFDIANRASLIDIELKQSVFVTKLKDIPEILRAAEEGVCPDALYQAGELYRLGDDSWNIAQNLELAEKYLRQAAEKNHPKANYSLGLMVEAYPFSLLSPFGNNETDAIPFYEKARDGGVAQAALRLGNIYEKHIGDLISFCDDPKSKAIESYEKALENCDKEIKSAAEAALKKLKPVMHHSSDTGVKRSKQLKSMKAQYKQL
jgi:TPR repeat protein